MGRHSLSISSVWRGLKLADGVCLFSLHCGGGSESGGGLCLEVVDLGSTRASRLSLVVVICG